MADDRECPGGARMNALRWIRAVSCMLPLIAGVGGFDASSLDSASAATLNGQAILVRFVISEITPNSCRFEQAFSVDGGRNWEVNWIAVDTRLPDRAATP